MVYAFWCASGFLRLCHTFFKWGFISRCGIYWWSSFLRKHTSYIAHFVFMCHLSPPYLTQTIFLSSSFPFLLASFNNKVMQICGDIMGLGSWEFIQGPLTGCWAQLPIYFGGISFLSMEDCAPFTFLGSWVLVAPYLCSMFHIFDRPILEEYFLGWRRLTPPLVMLSCSLGWPFTCY